MRDTTTVQIDRTSPSSQITDVDINSSTALETSTVISQWTTTRQSTGDSGDNDGQLSTTDLVVVITASCIVACLLGLLAVGIAIHCVRHGRCSYHKWRW